jgi:predicted PurR-regulated permease PerM
VATEGRWPPVTYWMKVAAGVLLVVGVARLLLAIGDILVLVLVSLILAFGFQPAVAWLERRGLSRGWAVGLGLLLGALVSAAFLALVLPDVIRELVELARAAPDYIARATRESSLLADLNQRFDLESRIQDLGGELPGTVLGLAGSFATLVFNSLTVLVLTIYFTINLPSMRTAAARLLGRGDRQEFDQIYDLTIRRVGGYVLGNLAISAIAGVSSFIVLLIIGVPFAVALAFVVAVTDLIPTVGAIIGAAVAAAVAAFSGLPEFIATVAWFVVYQQVENYVIQPRVMGRTVQMSAALVIVAVLIGGALLGVIGALLAIPTAAIVQIVVRELVLEERLAQVGDQDTRGSPPPRPAAP